MSQHCAIFGPIRYLSLIQTKREEYKKVTWDHIVEYINLESAIDVSGGLSKKQREAIKDKYSGFNEAFDLVVETQVPGLNDR